MKIKERADGKHCIVGWGYVLGVYGTAAEAERDLAALREVERDQVRTTARPGYAVSARRLAWK